MSEQTSPVHVGEELISWEVDEYPRYERTRTWFIWIGIIGTLLMIYAFYTANSLFAIIILMLGIITLVSMTSEPGRMSVIVTTTGVVVGDKYYEYRIIKDFSIVYDPPEVKLLYLGVDSPWIPVVSIPLEDIDPNKVRKHLLVTCIENLDRSTERLTDLVRRLYKI